MSKKKLIIITCIFLVYAGCAAGICFKEYYSPRPNQGQPGVESPIPAVEPEQDDFKMEFRTISDFREYTGNEAAEMYFEADEMKVRAEDRISLLEYYKLPTLKRMNRADAQEKMGNLQVFGKMEGSGAVSGAILYPEYNWKAVYEDALTRVEQTVYTERDTVVFEGTLASELNAFLEENQGKAVEIAAGQITLDETVLVPSNTFLKGNNAVFTAKNKIEYAFLIENKENIGIEHVRLMGGFDRGIYIINSRNMMIYRNEISGATYKPFFVMGKNEYINVVGNSMHDNEYGSAVFQGDISNCIVQHNDIYLNRGARNLGAGMVFSAVPVYDIYLPYEQEYGLDEYLFNMLEAPHDIVVKDNRILENHSSGVYLDGAYQCYVIDNEIRDNEKEGICLDFGSFGCYVSRNTIARNGDRNRQSDHDLDKDFVLGLGRLEDGSSTAKLPGISIDNGAYNIIYNNIIMENAGSGVKMVRSGFRNLILINTIVDNNEGQNVAFHGFGVELGHASKPDQEIKGLDFTADFENIVARNVISGHHYSGIYIAQDCYCNDLIDNIILDCTTFSVENYSELYNSAVGNNTNVGTLNFELQ